MPKRWFVGSVLGGLLCVLGLVACVREVERARESRVLELERIDPQSRGCIYTVFEDGRIVRSGDGCVAHPLAVLTLSQEQMAMLQQHLDQAGFFDLADYYLLDVPG